MRSATIAFLFLIPAFAVHSALVEATESVVIIDIAGEKTSGVLKSWNSKFVVIEATSERKFPIDSIRAVVFERSSRMTTIVESAVLISGGDRIAAKPISTANEMLTISWPLLGSVSPPKMPLERVVAMILESPNSIVDCRKLWKEIATIPANGDLIIFKNGDRLQGEFEKLDAAFVELKAGPQRTDRSRVRAVRFDPELSSTPKETKPRLVLTLNDGSRITTAAMEMSEAGFELNLSELGNVILPASSVVACRIFGESIVPISQYEPAKVEFTPFLSANWPLVRNANVMHGPLILRGDEFSTGLGIHSRSSVTYNLRGVEKEFHSHVGIDDCAGGNGSVVFAVDVDGKRVWSSEELTGKSAAVSLPNIPLMGAKQITLFVDFGQFADVSDYADWCDAVLIIDRKK